MSYTPTAESFATDHAGPRRMVVPVGIGSFAVAAFWIWMGAHDTGEVVSMVALCAVVAGLVYGVALPRALTRQSAPNLALSLSTVAALVTLPAFWSGLPVVLGSAGALLGHAGRNAVTGSKRCVAALVLGTLAVAGYVTIYVIDGLVMGNI